MSLDERDITPEEGARIRLMAQLVQAEDKEGLQAYLMRHPEFLKCDPNSWESQCLLTLFGSAVGDGELSKVKMLHELGMDLNQSVASAREGPMWRAARNGHMEMVRWMLDHGAEFNSFRDGKVACSTLTAAARGGHMELVKFLVARGADLSASENGVNGLMEAEFYGHPEVAEYLRSIGMKDVRATSPPNYPEAHEVLMENMVNRAGTPSDWKLEVPGTPAVTIHHIPADPQREDYVGQMLFTIGLSDHRLPDGDDEFHCTELRMHLPPNWPLTPEALADPQWNWPVEWMKSLIEQLRSASNLELPPVFLNEETPLPLGPNTELCGWVGMQSGSNHCQMPDYRWISLLDLSPIYLEEAFIIRNEGTSRFAQRLEARSIPLWIDPNRPNVSDDSVSDDSCEAGNEQTGA
ncbi:MAG: ankyrin repeat domain-containing protein [Planctomycetaceae bacterium]|nr:ankyrin repeat domain-containing protein [Planctomycetaceae bacterium]MCB9949524.1 ankyrin repeat domain-containing protein [Planctomycetaceae bacterium]